MNFRELIRTAKAMVADDKGILAMDESLPTCNKRFAKLGIVIFLWPCHSATSPGNMAEIGVQCSGGTKLPVPPGQM